MIARALLATLVTLALPRSVALACAACRDPNDASQGAFLLGTALLSLLPLALFGGLALYLRQQLRASAAAEALPRAVGADDVPRADVRVD